MASDSFVHLHNHSEYSMLDGAAKTKAMAEEVVASVGHMPRRRAKVGFSVIIPFLMTLRSFIVRGGYLL